MGCLFTIHCQLGQVKRLRLRELYMYGLSTSVMEYSLQESAEVYLTFSLGHMK